MIKDLVDAGVRSLDAKGRFSKEKISGKAYEKCIVRFIVQDGIEPDKCWQDKELVQLYQKYYVEKKKGKESEDICYMTGEKSLESRNHPKGIMPTLHI